MRPLTAGRYNVAAEKEGFRKAVASNVVVEVNHATRLDIPMQLGAVQATIQVESTAPLLQTDRSDLGTVVDNRAIQQLPLFINGGLRSNLAFTSLAPGVTMNLQNDPDTVGHYYSDLHATILKQMGLDHKKMQFRALGRNFRLVEEGHGPIEQIIA